MTFVQLPVVVLLVGAIVGGLTQVIKFFGEMAGPAWAKVVPQIVAAVVASLLSILVSLHVPIGINTILMYVINQVGPALTPVLLAAGSYVAHDLAMIAQGLKDRLKA